MSISGAHFYHKWPSVLKAVHSALVHTALQSIILIYVVCVVKHITIWFC